MSQNQPKQKLSRNQGLTEPDELFGNSSYLAGGSYNPDSKVLTIFLKSGSTYSYWPCSPEVWTAMKQSQSPGAFYAKGIKGKLQNVSAYRPLQPSSLPRKSK